MTECALSITNVIIVSVTKMKAINLNKERSIFLPVVSMEHSHNAQKDKELHYDKKIDLCSLL